VEFLSKTQVASTVQFSYITKEPVTVQLEQFFFPGWQARSNNRVLPIRPNPENGWTLVDLPAGKNDVVVSFKDTPIRKAGKGISLGTLLLMAVGLTVRKAKKPEAIA
jgi:hypothetical protein